MWDDAELIHSYTRVQAIEDGVLVEAPAELAREAGFTVPLAVTRRVFDLIDPNEAEVEYGQDPTGRWWDFLMTLRYTIKAPRPEGADPTVRAFQTIFVVKREEFADRRGHLAIRRKTFTFKCVSGPGDDGEHVLTVMFPDED